MTGLVVVYFIASGKFTPGQREFFGGDLTPTLVQAITFAVIFALVAALFALVRHKLSPNLSPANGA